MFEMPFVPFTDSLIDKLQTLSRMAAGFHRVLLIDVKVLMYQKKLKVSSVPSTMAYFER